MSLILGAIAGLGAGAANVGAEMQKAADVAERDKRVSDLELDRQATMEHIKMNDELNKRWSTMAGILGVPSSTGGAAPAASDTTSGATPTTGAPAQRKSDGINAEIASLSKRFNIPEEVIRSDLFANGGKGIAKMLDDRTKPEMVVVNGVAMDKNNLKPGVVPSVNTSSDGKTSFIEAGPDGRPVVSVPQGAEGAFGTYQGIQAGIKSATSPIQVYNPDTKRMEFTSEAAALKAGQPAPQTQPAANAQPQPNPNRIAPADQAAKDADALSILQSERQDAVGRMDAAKASGDRVAMERAQGDITALDREMTIRHVKSQTMAATPASQAVGAGRLAAGPSDTEKAAAEALGPMNRNFIEKSYQPVQEAGAAAQSVIESAKVARDAVTKMGGTGFGKEARAQAMNVLVGLGVGTDRAKIVSENLARFNTVAMERLEVTLNAARGAQTDTDARRAQQTFAQLSNPTDANRFVLDLAQARAERDVMRANFYADMLPEAQKAGDLAAIDRLWNQRQPSVFSMPTMKAWGVK
jgi:hypothetical protein